MITASGRMTEILPELLPLMQAQPASEPDADREHSDAGSNGLNRFTSLLVGEVGNAFACHPAVTEALQECMQPLDVMGYNYFAGRHAFEKQSIRTSLCWGQKPFLPTWFVSGTM